MASKATPRPFDRKAISRWTLYVIRKENGHYYIGLTSRKDYMERINEHGGRLGAVVNRGHKTEEIIEIQDLGKMSGFRAGQIENDVTLQYRKKYGAHKVRGGYDIYKKTSIVPTYTPGSRQSYIFIIACILLAIVLLILIAKG